MTQLDAQNAQSLNLSNNRSNGGYNISSIKSTALAYVDSTLSGTTSIGAIMLIAQDITPGKEFFCWALKTHGGNDDLHRDSCHALYKSPGTTGWNSIAIFPRTSKQFYGQVVLHGYLGNSFGGLPSAISASIYANGGGSEGSHLQDGEEPHPHRPASALWQGRPAGAHGPILDAA